MSQEPNALQKIFADHEEFPKLVDMSDEVTNLLTIVTDFDMDEIQKPLHQRNKVWGKEKNDDWIHRIKNEKLGAPIGVIVTYQLNKNNNKRSPIFLNDGYQRINATLEYLADPLKYGDSQEKARRIVRSTKVPLQHRHYESHDDALKDFQNINKGTHLTPREFYHGVLAYMNNYKEIWQDFIEDIHSAVQSQMPRFSESKTAGRAVDHVRWRDDMALFFRYITRDKTASDYYVSQREVKREDRENTIESKLRKALEKSNIKTVKGELKKFSGLTAREASTILDIWHKKLGRDIGISPNKTLYRWLLHCAIWKRNNTIPNDAWEEFIEKVLYYSGGKAVFPRVKEDKNGNRTVSSIIVQTGSLNSLGGVVRIVESDIFDYYTNKRSGRKNGQYLPGIDESHLRPFAEYGEGETIPEPASRNRARGKKPI